MNSETVAILVALLGVVARVFVPWLLERANNPDKQNQWDWKHVWPQLIFVVVLVAIAPVFSDGLELVTSLSPVAAYLFGWGVADFGKTLIERGGALGAKAIKGAAMLLFLVFYIL